MRILVIDDERTFNEFKVMHWLKIYEMSLVYARTYNEALKCLMSDWDIVYLDHDLGEGKSGYDIVNDIERVAHNGKILNVGKFVIHSMNSVGRLNMFHALRDFYSVEFARVEDLL
jgi:DNA-binding NtrC family response regulator